MVAATPLSDRPTDPFRYKAIYARDLLHGLGDGETVEGRSIPGLSLLCTGVQYQWRENGLPVCLVPAISGIRSLGFSAIDAACRRIAGCG